MRAHLRARAQTIALAVAISTVVIAGAPGSDRSPPEAACVAYDLHVLTLIEDHGLVEDVAPEVLKNAASRMFEARTACRQGDIERAVQIYDNIHLDPIRMTPLYRVLLR
jgi:hypothetical protein